MPQRFNSYFQSVEGNEGARCHYPTRLDTYGCGCQHNCGYCYARSLLAFRVMWNPAQPAAASPRDILRVIATKLHPGDVVRLGGMTDCFQPMERARKNTLRAIRWLNQRRVHYLIVTKNDLVAEYIPEMDPALAHIQVSITSTDPAVSRRVEPGAPLPEARIAAVEQLAAAGFDVSVRLSPFIPEWLDLGRINAIGCDKALVEFLRVNAWIRKWLGALDPPRRPIEAHAVPRRIQPPPAYREDSPSLRRHRLPRALHLRGRAGALGVVARSPQRQPRRLLQPQNHQMI